jgi:hypothetical protein
MTHKLNIEEVTIYPNTISVFYDIDGIQSEEYSHYLVLREAFDLWLEFDNKLKGTDTRYCQVINDTIDEDWEMTIEDVYADYSLLKDLIKEYLLSNKLITL